MSNRLSRAFFTVPTVTLAKELLGCTLVRETTSGRMSGIIIETEAYTENDAASHAFAGRRTGRNEMMFADGGHTYVYISYGIHHCLNIVSEGRGKGCAVLIRAIKPVRGIALMQKNRGDKNSGTLTNGPGKLCQALSISPADNGIDITDKKSLLYILPKKKKQSDIRATPRIGITRARDKKWRFILSRYCSGT